MTKNGLSHAEVWDDSALVTSWNEALEEYKVLNISGKQKLITC